MSDFSFSNVYNNLPGQMNPLIGRQEEVDKLKIIIKENHTRLITLTGPGGIGKTRLALEVAGQLLEDFQDGVFVVTLTGLMEQQEIISAINQVLRIKETSEQTLLEALNNYLQSVDLLLVLDNLEWSDQVTTFIEELLLKTKGLKVLGTGRTNVNCPGEKLFQVPPLPVPYQGQFADLTELENYDSIALFTERARLVRSDFKVTTQNGTSIAKICWRLNGLPLALELAAARLKTLSTQALLSRLDRGLGILTQGPVDWPVQQQTLRATIELSFNSLTQPEQEFFAKLAVFSGSWSLDAAQTIFQNQLNDQSAQLDLNSVGTPISSPVTSLPGDQGAPVPGNTEPKGINELLTSLVSQSMLQPVSNPLGGNRFEMLEIIREFALERLSLTGQESLIRESHAAYYLNQAVQIAPRLTGPEQGYWYRQLELEYVNLRSALNWLIVQVNPRPVHVISALRLSLALWRYWHFRGSLKEGLSWLDKTLQFSQQVLKEGATPESDSLFILGLQHRLIAAMAVFTLEMGDYPYAEKLLEQSLAWHRKQGNRLEIGGVLSTMGGMAANRGNYEQATSLFQESLQIQQQLGDSRGIAVALCSLAAVRQASGSKDEAQQLYQQALPLVEEVGDRQMLAQLLNNYGELLRFEGKVNEARTYSERSLSINQELNDIHGIARSYISLGELFLVEEAYLPAGELFRLALIKLNRIGDKRYIAVCMEALAAATWGLNTPERAARLLGASAAIREKIGTPLEPGEQPRYGKIVREIQAHFGKEEFTAYRAEGYDLPLEETLNMILHAEALV